MFDKNRFLSAFLDRLSKAKNTIEEAEKGNKGLQEVHQLSTRIIQQWNMLFPGTPIQSLDSISTNTLIATKTRYELSLSLNVEKKWYLIVVKNKSKSLLWK